MNHIAIVPRLLGSLLYLPPNHATNRAILSHLSLLPDMFPWEDPTAITDVSDALQANQASFSEYAYSVLCEGQGEMIAPPWGSVYQEKDNSVMGKTTADFTLFLAQHAIEVSTKSEPNDHYGLMLWAMSALLEDGQDEAVVILLEQHLLPWAYRYLELLESNQTSQFYANVARLNRYFLLQLQHSMQLNPRVTALYK
ncbi:MAG: molecular chaperone TorD family protein [Vibrio sp.]